MQTTTWEKSLLITQAMSLNFSFETVFFAHLKMASISWIILGLCLNHNIYNIGVLISLSPNDNHYDDQEREKKTILF